MKIGALFEGIDYRLQYGTAPVRQELEIAHVRADLENVGEDTVFLCENTPLRNGHRLAASAYDAGCRFFVAERGLALSPDATVLVVESVEEIASLLACRLYGAPSTKMRVIGIAGPCGKTTTALMLRAILLHAGYRVASLTSQGVFCGEEEAEQGPIAMDGAEIQRNLAKFVEARAEIAILELSDYQLERHVFDGVRFADILMTDGNGVKEGWQNDAAVAQALALPTRGLCLPTSLPLLKKPRGALFYGEGGELFFEDVLLQINPFVGIDFRLYIDGRSHRVQLPIPAAYAAADAVAACALARRIGVGPDAILSAFSVMRIKGTLCPLSPEKERVVFSDSAYEEKALGRALRSLRPYVQNRLCVLVGSVGGRAYERREGLGACALSLSDFVYFTADDPDGEDPEKICREMIGAHQNDARYVVIPDREAAIRRAVRDLAKGDILLLAGKGGQRTQLVNGERVPFCEEQLVLDALPKKSHVNDVF